MEKLKISPHNIQELKAQSEKMGQKGADVVLAKLERESLDVFDGESIRLLEATLKDKNKITLLTVINEALPSIFSALGPRAAGVFAYFQAAEFGKKYASDKARRYVTAQGQEYLAKILFDENGWLATVKKKVNEELQQKIIPLIDDLAQKAGELAGSIAEVPSGVAGFLVASGVTGGIIGVYREAKRSRGFEYIGEKIDRSNKMVKTKIIEPEEKDSKKKKPDDPRLSLLVLQRKILEHPKRMGHKLKNEEWLQMVLAARAAKIDLLREKTAAPAIVTSPEVGRELAHQARLAEAIIADQAALTEIDREATTEILSQFDRLLNDEMDPIEKRFKNYNSLGKKTLRYGAAFATSGLEATGIPLLWRVTRFSAKVVRRIVLPI